MLHSVAPGTPDNIYNIRVRDEDQDTINIFSSSLNRHKQGVLSLFMISFPNPQIHMNTGDYVSMYIMVMSEFIFGIIILAPQDQKYVCITFFLSLAE